MSDIQPCRVIDIIEECRRINNKNWMDLLRLAVRRAPKEARAILAEINKTDLKISRLLGKLAEQTDGDQRAEDR